MNSVVRQLLEQQTDVVMVDTFQGEAHLHEPLQGHGGGIQAELRREEELPQIAGVPHLQGQRIPQQN